MQRSSETIGAIAAALAKAQIELTNPEKSLTGTVASESPREDGRTFRYAPLSSGLEIVRKCLGKHAIAAVQTTAIDKDAGLIRLTTTLAHASGEWLSSEWPVCPVSETNAPHRLGAALTYARRHALFTLVGIAGDDDTDAPAVPARAGSSQDSPSDFPRTASPRRGLQLAGSQSRDVLSPEHSLARRGELMEELSALNTEEQLTAWAQRSMQVKNSLCESDARWIDKAFEERMAVLNDAPTEARNSELEQPGRSGRRRPKPIRTGPQGVGAIDKSVLAFPEPKRIRDKEHLRFVAAQACLVCGRNPSDAHHIRFAQLRALGRKVSDEFTVPVCRTHHREIHKHGDERAWWQSLRLDPLQTAAQLWQKSRALPAAGSS